MKIERTRYIITRNDRKEIFCGLARNYNFKEIENIGNTMIKTYATSTKANLSFQSSWGFINFDYEVLPVKEIIEIKNER